MNANMTSKMMCGLVVSMATVAFGQNPPPNGIDPVVVRLNGTSAITQDVIPTIVDQQNLGHFEMGRVNLLNTTANITVDFGDSFGSFFDFLGDFTFGVTFESFLRSVEIDLPVDDDTIVAQFRTATAPNGRVRATINVPNGTLDTTLRVRTRLNVDLPDFIPAELENGVMAITNVTDDFPIGVDGVSLTMQVLLAQSGTGVTINTVEAFTPQVGSVSVSDATGLVNLASDFSIAINRIFGLPGTGSVNAFATTLTNNIIRDNQDIRNMFRNSANTALNQMSRIRGYSASLPNINGVPLSVSAGLGSFSTRINSLTTNWNLNVQATGDIVNPALTYSYLARTAQTLTDAPAAGDMQAFLPLSLFDKFGHELARKGVFSMLLPIPATSGAPAFNIQVSVNGTPRATVSGTSSIKWRIPIGLANSGTLAANTPRLSNVTATLEVIMSLDVDNRNGLTATMDDISLVSITGTVRIGTSTIAASGLRTLLEDNIFDGLASTLPSLTVVPKVVNLAAPFAVSIGTVTVGSQYVTVPLSVVIND